MSDISIRLDGLLLAAAIMLGILIFAIVFVVVLIMAASSEQHRDHRIGLAKAALAHGAISLACLLAVIVYMNGSGPLPSRDWIDWMILPWTILFALGVVRLVRLRGSSNDR